MRAQLPQSCLTLYDPIGYSWPGSSVHEILQVRILESLLYKNNTNAISSILLITVVSKPLCGLQIIVSQADFIWYQGLHSFFLIEVQLVAQWIKNPLAMKEMWVRSLCQEDSYSIVIDYTLYKITIKYSIFPVLYIIFI